MSVVHMPVPFQVHENRISEIKSLIICGETQPYFEAVMMKVHNVTVDLWPSDSSRPCPVVKGWG